jgi:hypothetical protein
MLVGMDPTYLIIELFMHLLVACHKAEATYTLDGPIFESMKGKEEEAMNLHATPLRTAWRNIVLP